MARSETLVVAHQDIEAEQMVISAIFQDQDAILKSLEIIGVTDLYSEKHRLIFDACIDLYKSSVDIDPVTVRDRLKAKGYDEQCGGLNYLYDCMNLMPTGANVKVHSRIVKEASLLRKIDRWLCEKKQGMHSGDKADMMLTQMQAELVAMSELIQNGKDPYCNSIMESISKGWDLMASGKIPYIRTDAKIGDSIPAYYPGHLWMIGGYTSSGKSTFLGQIVTDISKAGARVLIFSTEDSVEEKMMALISNAADISKKSLLMGDFTQQERPAVLSAMSYVNSNLKPIMYDNVRTADEIRLKSKKHKLKDNVQVVCVDYVQNLRGDGSLYEKMSDAAEKLFSMGRELGVTVIVLSQVTNDSVKDDSGIIALKGAGELAAAADIVLWLKRSKEPGQERYLDVEVRKNRPFGTTCIIPLQFNQRYTRIDRR